MALDFYRPLKLEQNIDGTQIDTVPTEADESEDVPLVHAVAIGDKNTFVKKIDSEIVLQDGVSGEKKLSELTGGAGVSQEFVVAMCVALG